MNPNDVMIRTVDWAVDWALGGAHTRGHIRGRGQGRERGRVLDRVLDRTRRPPASVPPRLPVPRRREGTMMTNRAVVSAVDMTVYWTVNRAVDEAVDWRMSDDPPHPSSVDFLTATGTEAP